MAKSRSKDIRHEQLYAVTQDGELLQIDDTYADEEDVYCIYCACKMMRKRGEQRMHHYAHDYRSMREKHVDCTYDLYLQAYAKQRLFTWFKQAPQINVHYTQKLICVRADDCKWMEGEEPCHTEREQAFDIKRACTQMEYVKLTRTTSLSSTSLYRLINPDKPNNYILLVLRACEEEDSDRNDLPTGRVIELWIDNESDIDTFIDNYDLQDCSLTHYHGFAPKSLNSNNVPSHVTLMRFTLYKSGHIYTDNNLKCIDCNKRMRNSLMQVTINPFDNRSSYQSHWYSSHNGSNVSRNTLANWGMAIASGAHFNRKFCAMCKQRYYQNGSFCCKNTGEIHTMYDNADNCDDYEADLIWIKKKLTEYENYKKYHYVDYWVGES